MRGKPPVMIGPRHPLIDELHRLMGLRRYKVWNLAEEAHDALSTFTSWRCGRSTPTLAMMDRILGVLGYRLAIVPLEKSAGQGVSVRLAHDGTELSSVPQGRPKSSIRIDR